AKIMMGFIQQLDQSRAVENINSHRGEESLVLRPKAELRIPIRTQLELILYRGIFRFLDEFRNDAFFQLHQTKAGNIFALDGNSRDRYVRPIGEVLAQDQAVIHPVKLVAAQNQHIFEWITLEMLPVF